MATLQKFKILATQCGVAQSPTRSPRTSPLVQFPRKKTTLRMLLTRSSSSRCKEITLPTPKEIAVDDQKQRDCRDLLVVQSRNKLKDLFVSSNFNKLFMPQGAEHPGFRETLYSKIQFYGKFPQQGRWKISPTGKLEKKKAGQCLAVS